MHAHTERRELERSLETSVMLGRAAPDLRSKILTYFLPDVPRLSEQRGYQSSAHMLRVLLTLLLQLACYGGVS